MDDGCSKERWEKNVPADSADPQTYKIFINLQDYIYFFSMQRGDASGFSSDVSKK